MNWSMVLFGVMPLVIFVVVDSYSGLKAGIIWACVFAFAELIYSLVVFKRIDELTICTILMVVIFGLLSLRSNNPIFFKMQPVAIGAMTSLLLFGFHLAGKPLLIFMIEKYGQSFPADIQAKFSNPLMRSIMINAGVWLGFGFFFHAAGVAYAALYLSNWWWLAIRGAGVYVMMIICMFGASYTARL